MITYYSMPQFNRLLYIKLKEDIITETIHLVPITINHLQVIVLGYTVIEKLHYKPLPSIILLEILSLQAGDILVIE